MKISPREWEDTARELRYDASRVDSALLANLLRQAALRLEEAVDLVEDGQDYHED